MKRLSPIGWSAAGIIVVALATGAYLQFRRAELPVAREPVEKLTIAVLTMPLSAGFFVAESKGLFRKYGLDVTLQIHTFGKPALAAVSEGTADLALVAETPFVFSVLRGEKLKLIATFYNSTRHNVIVARRDRHIQGGADLAGKKIGVPIGTSAHFYLDTYLNLHRVTKGNIEITDMRGEETVGAIASGRVDAIATFSPYDDQARRTLGDSAITLSDPTAYEMSVNIVGTSDFVNKRAGAVERLMRALADANDYMKGHAAEAKDITAGHLKMDRDLIDQLWGGESFGLSLSQTLFTLLEDESRWAIRNKLTAATVVPNYLEFIYPDALAAVRPGRVTLIR